MAAKTKKEVEQQSAKDRLWESLDYSYGQQREASDKAYAQAYSQADRQALSRGMQRSSYNNQTLANINQQKIKAQNDIYGAQIADYQNRLTDIENQEKEDERWERQFAEGQRQFNESQEFQRQENALNRAFQTSERMGSQEYQSGENALNRAFSTSEREAQQAYNTSERQAQQQYNTSERQAQQQYQSAENALNRAFTTSEREAQQAYQSAENALTRSENARQFDTNLAFQQSEANRSQQNTEWQQAFQQQQADLARSQWEQEFGYQAKTDEQKIAMSYISNIMANGGDPSDELLAQAGLSRSDYNAMKAKTSTYVPSKTNTGNGNGDVTQPASFSDFVATVLGGLTNGNQKDSIRNDTSLAGRTSSGGGLFTEIQKRTKKD